MLKWLVNNILKIITHILLIIDASELEDFPEKGPLLVVGNHVNFLDPVVIITQLHPRPTTGLAKKESWDNPFHAFLFNVWGGIPIDRDIADFKAFELAKQALKQGKILAVTPEGTRTEDGRLVRGKPGVTILALQCDVPITPMAYYGHENFTRNLKRLKRTPFTIVVGEPFRINLHGERKNKETLQTVADEIMVEIAKLLPEKYHGEYFQDTFPQPKYLEYLD